jgi:hypothetical protein
MMRENLHRDRRDDVAQRCFTFPERYYGQIRPLYRGTIAVLFVAHCERTGTHCTALCSLGSVGNFGRGLAD